MIRWLRWNLVCWRGRRCADVVIAGELDEEKQELLAGNTVCISFRCGGCGTVYRRDAIIGNDGAYSQLDRVRVG